MWLHNRWPLKNFLFYPQNKVFLILYSPNAFISNTVTFIKLRHKNLLELRIFKIKDKCQPFNDVLKMKMKHYIFLVMNVNTEHHVRQSQEPSHSGNSDSNMFHFPGFISMPNATVQQWTMPLIRYNTASNVTGHNIN